MVMFHTHHRMRAMFLGCLASWWVSEPCGQEVPEDMRDILTERVQEFLLGLAGVFGSVALCSLILGIVLSCGNCGAMVGTRVTPSDRELAASKAVFDPKCEEPAADVVSWLAVASTRKVGFEASDCEFVGVVLALAVKLR